MTLIERFSRLMQVKFSFGKGNVYARDFAKACGAMSMYEQGYGLGIPLTLSNENQLRAVFVRIVQMNGVFLFNISGVDLRRAEKGFSAFYEAEGNNQITEWELFMILSNMDYRKSCIFHNGKVSFKKTILWKSILR